MSETLVGTTSKNGRIQTRTQASLLSKSLLVAGVGFLVVFGIASLIYWILNTKASLTTETNAISILYTFSIICIIGCMFMSMYIWARISKVSISTVIICLLLYAFGEGLAFGILFYAIGLSTSYHMGDIVGIFALTGLIFTITGLIGTMLSLKATINLGKFVLIASFAFLGLFVIVMILSLCGLWGEKSDLIFYGIFGALTILYILYDFSSISKMNEFVQAQDSKMQLKLTLMFGFKLLIDFIALLWVVIRFYLASRR